MLILPIEKESFDMIVNFEKEDVYLKINSYSTKQLAKAFDIEEHKLFEFAEETKTKKVTHIIPVRNQIVCFKCSSSMKCKVMLLIRQGMEELGAKQGTWYYVLKILDILDMQSYV